MLMNKLIILIVFLCTFSAQTSFASSWDTVKPQTLLEMQEEKEALEKQENVLQFKWNTFKLWNDSLEDIVKIDLNTTQKLELEDIISVYLESKEQLEGDLNKSIESGRNINEIEEELLTQKHSFYKSLIPYIQISKLEAFKKYVDSDLTYNEKSKNIKNKIDQKDIEQEKRLEELYDDRDDSARDLRKSIEKSITIKVSPKIDQFVKQEKFSDLSWIVKIEIFTNMIRKFEDAISDLENTSNPTRALEERIIGLEVVVDILNTYIDTWK